MIGLTAYLTTLKRKEIAVRKILGAADRAKQFDSARRFIENIEGGVDAPLGKSFLNRKKRSVRVDIEILAGTAFVVALLLFYFL